MVIIMEIPTLIISIFALTVSIATPCVLWRRDKKIRTIAAYEKLQEFLYFLYSYDEDEIETFVTDPASEEYKAISNSIARIEMFAAGIRNRLYDFDIFYPLAHGYLDGALRNSIESIIEMKNTGRNEEFYKNTTWLLEKMDERSSN